MASREIEFSILCPTHNRSRLLRRAIDSAVRQRFKNFELVIVNDGSIDDTIDVVKSYSDKRIIYIEHKQNKGVNAALNTGLEKARGKYVALLGDDDELEEFALQMAFDVHHRLPSDRIKIVFFLTEDVEAKLISGKYYKEEAVIKYRDFLCEKLRGDYWGVADRTILPAGKVLDEDSWGGSGVLWLSLLRNYDAYYVPKIAYRAYRRHGEPRLTNFESNSRSWKMHEHTTKTLLEEFGKDISKNCPKIYSKQLATLAFYQLSNGNFRLARSNLLLSLRRDVSVYALGLALLSFLGNSKIIQFTYLRLFKEYLDRTHF